MTVAYATLSDVEALLRYFLDEIARGAYPANENGVRSIARDIVDSMEQLVPNVYAEDDDADEATVDQMEDTPE